MFHSIFSVNSTDLGRIETAIFQDSIAPSFRTVLHQQRQCTANTAWWPTHLVNGFRQTIGHGCSPHEDPVVFVGGLGQAGQGRLLTHSLTVRHNWVRNFDGNPGMVLLQILQADLQMQFTSTSDDVLARLLSNTLVAERHTEQVSEHVCSEQHLNLSNCTVTKEPISLLFCSKYRLRSVYPLNAQV